MKEVMKKQIERRKKRQEVMKQIERRKKCQEMMKKQIERRKKQQDPHLSKFNHQVLHYTMCNSLHTKTDNISHL